jgi:hypothetical protein
MLLRSVTLADLSDLQAVKSLKVEIAFDLAFSLRVTVL